MDGWGSPRQSRPIGKSNRCAPVFAGTIRSISASRRPLLRTARGISGAMLTHEQIRGARAMLGLTQAVLAERAGISKTGLNNIERGEADPKASTLRAIQRALEEAGVEFTNGDQPGVRLGRRKDHGHPRPCSRRRSIRGTTPPREKGRSPPASVEPIRSGLTLLLSRTTRRTRTAAALTITVPPETTTHTRAALATDTAIAGSGDKPRRRAPAATAGAHLDLRPSAV